MTEAMAEEGSPWHFRGTREAKSAPCGVPFGYPHRFTDRLAQVTCNACQQLAFRSTATDALEPRMTDPTPAEALKAGDALREIDRITRLPGFDLGTLAWHLGEIQEITEAALAALPSPATDAGEVRKAPQWADDRDPMGDLAIKLAARASAIEEQEGRGEWTWREIAECAAEALGRSPTFADGVDAAAKAIPGIIAAAMREEWDEICNDTDCHPDDIEKVGRKTFYRARHWTAQIGEASAAAIRGLAR